MTTFSREDNDRLYSELFKQESTPNDQPHAWIQWKGTDACVDIHCACGFETGDNPAWNPVGHYDGYDMYAIECKFCGRVYRVMQNIGLVEATNDEQKKYLREYFRAKVFETDED